MTMIPSGQKMMMISIKPIFLLFLFLLILSHKPGFAKKPDVRLRLSGKINGDIFKKLNAGFEYEHRFDQNMTTFDKAFIEPSLSYKLTKKIQMGIQYRIMYDQNVSREREYKQRFSGYARYKFDIDDFEIKIKAGLQYGFDDLTNEAFNYDQKLINRNSIEIEYDWFGKKFKPFVEYEFFYHLNHPNGGIINQYRLKAGSSYNLTKSSKLSFYYAFENEMNIVAPIDSHIFGIGYGYSF